MDNFESLTEEQKERVIWYAGQNQVRNGKTQHDGSRGEIRITHNELLELFAKACKEFSGQ